MNDIERAVVAEKEIEEKEVVSETAEEALGTLATAAGTNEMSLVAQHLRTQERLIEAASPEGRAEALVRVREISERTRGRLKQLHLAAALALALSGTEPSAAEARSPIAPSVLAENPQRLEELLEGIIIVAEREQESTPNAALEPLKDEASEVLRKIQDERTQGPQYGALALRIGETAARALASAAGLGLGVAGYDILKEVVRAARGKST